jgi:hypothetical protein
MRGAFYILLEYQRYIYIYMLFLLLKSAHIRGHVYMAITSKDEKGLVHPLGISNTYIYSVTGLNVIELETV